MEQKITDGELRSISFHNHLVACCNIQNAWREARLNTGLCAGGKTWRCFLSLRTSVVGSGRWAITFIVVLVLVALFVSEHAFLLEFSDVRVLKRSGEVSRFICAGLKAAPEWALHIALLMRLLRRA